MELPADHSLAVTDPERFVALITEKLRKWCEEGEKQVEVREKMRLIEVSLILVSSLLLLLLL